VTCAKPEGAFYVYPNVKAYLGKAGVGTAMELSKRLLHEAHVVTVPGEAFGTTEHIRLVVRDFATGTWRRGLERMKGFLREAVGCGPWSKQGAWLKPCPFTSWCRRLERRPDGNDGG
jgi:hypothetical protein